MPLREAYPVAVFPVGLGLSVLFGGTISIRFTHVRLSLENLLCSRQIKKEMTE